MQIPLYPFYGVRHYFVTTDIKQSPPIIFLNPIIKLFKTYKKNGLLRAQVSCPSRIDLGFLSFLSK